MATPESSDSAMAIEDNNAAKLIVSCRAKRSVVHLSKAQLTRKRANDRDSQRKIRQKTKDYIEKLERRVKELETKDRATTIQQETKRNNTPEDSQTAKAETQILSSWPLEPLTPMPRDALLPRLDKPVLGSWTLVPGSGLDYNISDWSQQAQIAERPLTPTARVSTYPTSVNDAEVPWQPFKPLAAAAWNPSLPRADEKLISKHAPLLPPYASLFLKLPALSSPEAVSDGCSSFYSSTYLLSPPLRYLSQLSVNIIPAKTFVHRLMLNIFNYQSNLAAGTYGYGEGLVGSNLSLLHVLLSELGPLVYDTYSSSCGVEESMREYPAALSATKSGNLACPNSHWLIPPTYCTYETALEWLAPQSSQEIPHPPWMDLPPWPKFRDMIIKNQRLYGSLEFKLLYATNLNINWPYDPTQTLIFELDQVKLSPLLLKHLGNVANMSMNKSFADLYPEFIGVCRFTEE